MHGIISRKNPWSLRPSWPQSGLKMQVFELLFLNGMDPPHLRVFEEPMLKRASVSEDFKLETVRCPSNVYCPGGA